jgi:oligopeptide/dipeptide ABC transporter ATP-binding protein
VAVMYLGKLMELADRNTLYERPEHPYTQALLSAVPIPDPRKERAREHIILRGDVPTPLNPPTGCVFHPRCFHAEAIGATGTEKTVMVGKRNPRPIPRVCVDVVPPPVEHEAGHPVACHFAQVREVL